MTVTNTLPAFRSATTANDTGVDTLDITTPAGMAATDLLVLSVVVRDDRTVDTPSGWTALFSYTANNPGFIHYVFVRVAGAQSSPLTLTASDTTTWTAAMLAYENVTDAFPTEGVDGWGGPDGQGFLTAPLSLTGSEATAVGEAPVRALYFAASRAEDSVTWTAPTGFTERVDTTLGSTTLRFSQIVADAPYAGTPPPWTATPSGAHTKEGSAYLLLVGTSVWTPDTDRPSNPMEVFGEVIPFSDGAHTVWSGWNGAALVVEANLGGSAFRLNDDTYGRLNTARLGPAADGWVDLGADLADLELHVGATQDDGVLTRFEAGTLRLELGNWDQKFDPLNTDSPYYQDLHVGTKVRVAGTQYSYLEDSHAPVSNDLGDSMFLLFTGRISNFEVFGYGEEDPRVVFHVEDDVAGLTAYNAAAVDPAVGAGDDLTERVERIVAQTGLALTVSPDEIHPEWPSTVTYQSTTMAQPAWTEILLTCDAATVGAQIRGDGLLTLDPMSPVTSDYRLITFGDPDDDAIGLNDVVLAYDNDQVRNIIDVSNVGGSVQRFVNETSKARYGPRAWNRVDLPLQTSGQVATFGAYVLAHTADAAPRVTGITTTPQVYGVDPFHEQQQYVAGVPSGAPVGLPVWWTLCRLVCLRFDAYTTAEVTFTHPHTDAQVSQRVSLRGASMVVTPDVWEFRFVTSHVDSWFDVWTLADPSDSLAEAEQSRLSRGHRLAAA